MRSPVAVAFAIAFGLLVLIGYFIPAGVNNPALQNLAQLRVYIIDGAITIAAFATVVAILSMIGTHWRKFRASRNPDRYSFFTLFFFLATLVFGIATYFQFYGTPADFQGLVTYIQTPVEASLLAVLAVTLTLAGWRMVQRRHGILPIVFIISVLLYLLLDSGLLASINSTVIGQTLGALQFLPVAGGRGILLGIALGSIMAGLRILFGADRPYSG